MVAEITPAGPQPINATQWVGREGGRISQLRVIWCWRNSGTGAPGRSETGCKETFTGRYDLILPSIFCYSNKVQRWEVIKVIKVKWAYYPVSELEEVMIKIFSFSILILFISIQTKGQFSVKIWCSVYLSLSLSLSYTHIQIFYCEDPC